MVCQFVYDGTNWLWVGHIDTNNDISVRQTLLTENTNKPLLLGYSSINDITENINNSIYRINNIYANPSTGTLTATNFSGKFNGHTINADVPANAVFTDTTYTGTNGIAVNATTHVITNSGVRSISAGVDAGTLTVNIGGAQQTIVIKGFQQDENGNGIAATYIPKTQGVTDVSWDSENNKLTRTINSVVGDVVSIGTIKTALNLTKTDVGLSNVENTKLSTWAGSGHITTIGTLTSGSIPWSLLTDVPELSTNNHIHGNIQSDGTLQTTDIVISNGDKLVITDTSDNDKVARASLVFDGSTTTQALTKKGTWGTFLTEHQSLNAYATKNSPALTGVPTAPTAADGTNNTQIATTAFVYNAFAANDAMIFKGTLSKASDLPAIHKQGWTYKVAAEGTYAGQYCEIGDTIYCIADGTSVDNADWTIVQTNVDGAVIGPISSTAEHIAVFTGSTGKAIKDSGFTIGTSVPANAKFTDTTYTFTAGTSSLAWNTEVTLATVGGLAIKAKLPVNPDTNTWRGIQDNLTSSTNTTESLSAKQGYLLANGSARDNSKLPLAGGTMTGRLIAAKGFNNLLTGGSGTVGRDAGSGASPRYFPSVWTFDTGLTASDGDIFTIKIPVAGHSYGVYLSIDNGTTYYPIVLTGTSRLTTHFGVNTYITVVLESGGSATSILARTGGNSTTTITGGVWRVINFYDSNTNTLVRTYASATNIDVPLIGSSSANSTTAAWSNYTGTYKDWYGVIPNDDAKRAKINLSTGALTVPGGIVGNASTATTASKVAHKLTFGNGAFEFDGSEDVNVPVYDGSATWA